VNQIEKKPHKLSSRGFPTAFILRVQLSCGA